AQCFSFSVPADSAVDEIMNAFQVAACTDGLQYLQHHGGVKLLAAVSSMAEANRLVARDCLVLRDVEVPLKPIGGHVIHVSVFRIAPYVSEEALVQALSPYGKVKAITYATFRDRPDVRTGTRVRARRTHRSRLPDPLLRPVWRARSSDRWLHGALPSLWSCARHDRLYAAQDLHGGHGSAPRPSAPSPETSFVPDALVRPTNLKTTPLAPQPYGWITPCRSTTQPARPKRASSPTASAQDAPGVYDDSLSSDSDSLVIADQTDVTPGQDHPAPTPTLPTSSPACESSTNPSSAEDINMPPACPDVKRSLSTTSSSSDAPHALTVPNGVSTRRRNPPLSTAERASRETYVIHFDTARRRSPPWRRRGAFVLSTRKLRRWAAEPRAEFLGMLTSRHRSAEFSFTTQTFPTICRVLNSPLRTPTAPSGHLNLSDGPTAF
ncbi:hypothetical protein HPB47_002245, partial [Ixodes persulcatus]